MRPLAIGLVLLASVSTQGVIAMAEDMQKVQFNKQLDAFFAGRTAEFDDIPAARQVSLRELADYVRASHKANKPVRLTFICTHNSRRSHMAQLWAKAAAAYYGLENVETYSGGTESTAFNPRAVAAMERAGFTVDKISEGKNPRYQVEIASGVEPQVCFSKVYDEKPNPRKEFCAVMTCSQADENCPVVRGASLRVAVPYEDPKAFDGTQEEAEQYSQRCAQVAREMLYLFSLAKED